MKIFYHHKQIHIFKATKSVGIITPRAAGAGGFKGKHPNFFLEAGKTLKTNIFPKSGKK